MSRLPIRVRVAMLGALAGLLASLAVAFVALWHADSLAKRDLDEFLSLETSEVVALITAGGSFSALVDVNPSLGRRQQIAVFDRNGTALDSTAVLPPTPDLTDTTSRYETLPDPATGEAMRTIVIPMVVEGESALLVVATPADYVTERVLATARSFIPLILLAVAIVGLGSYVITGLVLRPVVRLTASARDLAPAPSGRRLATPEAKDEIYSLATTLNEVLERLDQVMQQNREFVAQASHEMRAPLARLAADLEFTSRPTRSTEEVLSGLVALGTHTEDMRRVADELLDLLEERATELEPAPLVTLVDEVLEHVSHYPKLLSVVRCEDPEANVYCDVGQVAGAVRNLVDNAFEHGEPPVTIRITCNEHEVVFCVEDAGTGVPTSLHDSIGQAFVRGDDAGRAGLGLAIVSRVANRIGAELMIEVEPSSRVSLRVPLFRAKRSEIRDNAEIC